MKKKFTIVATIILVLALVATFSACGRKEEKSTHEPTPTQVSILINEKTEYEEDWYLDDGSLYGPHFKLDLERAYHYDIIGQHENRALLFDYTTRMLYLADAENKIFSCISDNHTVINYTVAYDTLYFFNTDSDVWAVEWWKTEKPSAVLYYKDAIAVSPFMDEGEGAIVEPEEANWEEYGLSIYSPYGD